MSQRRVLRAAEYYGRAAADARVLWGDKGALCVVCVLIRQSNVLVEHVRVTASADDATPLWLEAQRLLAECRRILNSRLSANTCLVGRCFAVEEDFFVRYNVMVVSTVVSKALTSEQRANLVRVKRQVGYEACMETAYAGLQFAYSAPLMVKERAEMQAFALRCVGIMATATHPSIVGEQHFAKLIRDLLASNHLEQPFKAELARVWNRPALQNALRARGVFEEGDAEDAAIKKEIDETLDKKAAADLAKHGLRWCALPSCAKQELRVFDFKQCSACKAVMYCSAEHAALHWTATHRKECASLKAAGAKPRSTADAGTERRRAHAPQAGAKPRSTVDAGTEWLQAHAPQLARRVSLACAALVLAIGLVLLSGAVVRQAPSSAGFAH